MFRRGSKKKTDDLPAGSRSSDPGIKLRMNIRIAMLYLEDDDPVNAEMYIKKAASVIAFSKVGGQ